MLTSRGPKLSFQRYLSAASAKDASAQTKSHRAALQDSLHPPTTRASARQAERLPSRSPSSSVVGCSRAFFRDTGEGSLGASWFRERRLRRGAAGRSLGPHSSRAVRHGL